MLSNQEWKQNQEEWKQKKKTRYYAENESEPQNYYGYTYGESDGKPPKKRTKKEVDITHLRKKATKRQKKERKKREKKAKSKPIIKKQKKTNKKQ